MREEAGGPETGLSWELREAAEEAGSLAELVGQVWKVVLRGVWLGPLLLLLAAVCGVLGWLGMAYLDQCPMEPRIPVYLMVGGSVGAVGLVVLFLKHRGLRREEEGLVEETGAEAEGLGLLGQAYASRSTRLAEWSVLVFLLVWFCLGNVWVWGIYSPPYSQGRLSPFPDRFCQRSLYTAALGQVLATHAALALLSASFALLFCYASHIRSKPPWM